jgi:predicted AlkP superfamily phosphohydrolase/phosphomutase
MTGLNPGRHGVFAFQRALNRDLERTYVNATAIQAPLLWERVSAHGLRVGVLNVPLTYPVRPVNGWLVSGMMTPSEESDFTYPAALAPALRQSRPLVISVAAGIRADRRDDVDLLPCMVYQSAGPPTGRRT